MSNPTHYVGFLDPVYTAQFNDAVTGNTLNLIGATNFSMFMVNTSNLAGKQCSGTWTISNQSTNPGQATYQWTSRDMDTAGNWLLYRSVQLASESYPREFSPDLVSIEINPATGGITVSTQDVNLINVNGNPIGTSNPVPVQQIEVANYIALTSPPTQTNTGTETILTFSQQVNHVEIYNGSGNNMNYAFDSTVTLGSLIIPPGYQLDKAKKVTAVHILTPSATNINGSSAGNIVVLGSL